MHAPTNTILHNLGLMVHVPGVMALGSVVICFLSDEPYAVWPFLWTALVSFIVGQALYRAFGQDGETSLDQGMLVAALAWLLVPVLGAIPFLLIATEGAVANPTVQAFSDPLNALFEAFSGFTGTGLTMAARPSQLPHSLQWWRSLMEWVGGMGVIVLMLSILKSTAGAFRLYYSEGREEKIFPTVVSTVRTMWWIYLLFTFVSVLALRLAGMPWWEALNHGMTGIATGGFGVTDRSIGDYGTPVKLVLLPVMLAGAVSFATHYQMLTRRRWRCLWQDSQHRLLWALIGSGSLLLVLENYLFNGEWGWVDEVFQWVSALSTAGFQSVDLDQWSPTAQLLLSLAMMLGGAAGSTAGGLKLMRLVLLRKGLLWRFERIAISRHQVMRYELDGVALSAHEANRMVEGAGVLAALWAVALWLAVLVLLHVMPAGYSLSDAILEVASAQGNVGLSVGITGPHLHPLGKSTLMLSMWIGRLEIIPVLILLFSLCSGTTTWMRKARR